MTGLIALFAVAFAFWVRAILCARARFNRNEDTRMEIYAMWNCTLLMIATSALMLAAT